VRPGCSDRRARDERSHKLLGSSYCLFRSPQVKATERAGDRDRYEASISPSSLATLRRASGYIVRQSMMSALVAMSVAIAEQLRGDSVTVGLVADQEAAEVVAGLRVQDLEE
jgi:hypothetical protein